MKSLNCEKCQNKIMEKQDVISQAFSRYLTGFCLSKAILEDYVKVIAKLENTPEQDVKDRIWKRTDEIFKEVMEKQLQLTQLAQE